MSIGLHHAVPGVALADYATLFCWLRADIPLFEDVERADLAQIRFRLTPGEAEYRVADGNVWVADDAHIVRPNTGAFRVRAPDTVHLFGAGITPAGWPRSSATMPPQTGRALSADIPMMTTPVGFSGHSSPVP